MYNFSKQASKPATASASASPAEDDEHLHLLLGPCQPSCLLCLGLLLTTRVLQQHHQWGQNRPALPPESSVPSTSGRSHLPPQPHGSHEPCHNNVSHDAYGYEETWDLPDDGFTPFPGNLPTGTGSEDPPPHQLFKSSRMYFGVQSSNERWRYLSQVWSFIIAPARAHSPACIQCCRTGMA